MIFGPDFHRDPYPVYRRLRDEAPCHHEPALGLYALSRYEDVLAALRQPAVFSSAARAVASSAAGAGPYRGADTASPERETAAEGPARSLLFLDPPEHQVLRQAVSRGFTPQAVLRLEPAVRDIAAGLADRIADRGGGEFVTEFAAPLAIAVILRLLGVPEADRARVSELLSASAPSGAEAELRSYWLGLSALLRGREDAGKGDGEDRGVVAELVRPDAGLRDADASAGPACRAPLTDEQVAAFCALVGQAGTESVAMALSNALVLFGRHHDQWRTLCARPDAIPAAFEEVLRYWAPTQHQGRTLTADVRLHGRLLPAGAHVLLLTGSAGRDERAYPDPDVFDIGRFHPDRRPSTALGFGLGAHFCLGAALARLQARVALRELTRRFPRYRTDEERTVRSEVMNGFGHSRVPFSM
ncbi:cytochrome P450 [Microbispora sp. ATCC PTA-5024]|uniref:cytochrome P450 n=1 Tax=Microbispora sp. ATCC PTA-5024 TaxID=316330 RepID=UPI0001AB3C0E|nr:cytochrome P450 [Microbispora sp. ATCC PTA-5024]ETK34048.1 cytochrome P450 [Microbispora sp. ATCC PTA-5024]